MKKPIKKDKKVSSPKKIKPFSDKTGVSKNKQLAPSSVKVTRKDLEVTVDYQLKELQTRSDLLKQCTDREKLAEEQVHIRTKAMDSALDGIFIITFKESGFPVLYANLSFQKLIGYMKNEIIGHDYFDLYGAKTDFRVLNEMKNSMREGKSFQGELLNFKKNGEKFWSSLRINPVRDTKGTITHFVGIQSDTTEMKKKILELEEQREELLHVTRVGKLAEFVSSLAHEISQPLTAILSYAQAAQRLFLNKEPELQEILQYIIDDDQRAAEVIKRLRLLLKKSAPCIETIDINGLINDTVQLIQARIDMNHIVIQCDMDKSLKPIQGDRIQLQQVVLNLLSNSLESMMANKNSREIFIRTSKRDAKTILVELIDSGSGISAENISKVFTHFFTSKANGLGMGLPISRSIIENHGGRLDAKSNSGNGASFYFTLPIVLGNFHE